MRRTTALMSQWQAVSAEGESLSFALCKGGYFSDKEEYGLKVVGKTEQRTLSGKNLMPTRSYKGNVSFSARKNFTVTGLIPETDYTFSLVKVRGDTALIYVNNTNKYYTLSKPAVIKSTVDGEIMIQFATGTAQTATIDVTDMQLELGDTATAYEEYCGSMASPSPEYPQEIRGVKQGTKIYVLGEALYKANTVSLTHSRNIAVSLPAGSYIASAQVSTTSPLQNCTFRFLANGSAVAFDAVISCSDQVTYRTFTIAKPITHICLYASSASNDGNVIVNSNGQTATFSGMQIFKIVGTVTTPCDLYDGDVWYPMSGVVKRYNRILVYKSSAGYSVMENIHTIPSPFAGSPLYVYVNRFSRKQTGLASTDAGKFYCNYNVTYNSNFLSFCIADGGNWSNLLTQWNDEGKPLTVIYKTSTPVIEQYDPQAIIAPSGTVNVLQTPVNLTADLSAAMLCRR